MSALLTHNYIRTRFWLAGVTIGLSVIVAAIVGLQALSAFREHNQYSQLFTDLIRATSQFESEMSRPSSEADAAAGRKRLAAALGTIDSIAALMKFLSVKDAAIRIGNPAPSQLELEARDTARRYGLQRGTMPDPLKAAIQESAPPLANLDAALKELTLFGRRLAEIDDRSSARYQAIASYLRKLIHQSIWPSFQRALDAIDKSTAATAKTAIALLALCGMAMLIVAILNTVFIFIPLLRAVMQNQRELVHERDRALASEKAKRDFLAMMSHELRTPMNGVLGFTNMLLSCDLPPKQRDYAETIHASGLTLLDLLNDILDISHIEAGALELETSDFSIEEVVGEVISLLAPQAFAKRLDIGAFIDPALPEKLSGDVGRVRQILLKLAGNAIKFTESGGIAIEVRHEGIRPDGDHDLKFSVTDTGIGVEAHEIATIFDQFTQADCSNRRQYGGAGLGLPICRELVQLMDGKIGVGNVGGQGSTFWFCIRLAGAVPPMDTIRESADGDLTGYRCLVVDDTPLNRRIFLLQLEGFGAVAEATADAEAAMEALGKAARAGRPFDVAVIDHIMPGTDGMALRKLIRAQPQFAALKLIISSSGGIAFDQQARALGFDAACPKPVIQEKLIRQIKALLRPVEAGALPGNLATMPQAAPPVPLPERKLQKARLLVVEDNAINQRLIMSALQQAGYVVDLVGDGVEAVHAVQRLPYDVVLMDIRMPVMGGVEATRRIRSLSGPAAARPIIAMTANTMIGDREEYLKAGMTDYIAKPIDFPILLSKIENCLTANPQSAAIEDKPARKAPGGGILS